MDRAFLGFVTKRLRALEKIQVDQAMARIYSVENYAPQSARAAREALRQALTAWLATLGEPDATP